VHCDWRVNSLIRLCLDEVFGARFHRNEISWNYSGWNKKLSASFEKRHDTIYYYSKGEVPVFYSYFEPYNSKEEYLKTRKQKIYVDEDGREYTLDTREGGQRQTRIYIEDSVSRGKVVDSVWRIDKLNNSAIAAVGYPTQKPESLIERIVVASSTEGDLIADFFCGSGTTAAVAEKLGRKWITSDLGKFSIHTTRKRMIGVQRQLKAEGKS
jgi:adenine-specific DNA-methyltransferase